MLGVINVLGLILTAFGATFALPLVTALIAAGRHGRRLPVERSGHGRHWLRHRRATKRHARELKPRDGFLLVTLGWALMSAAATIPLLLLIPRLSFTDAYFETMSGLTTTGATMLTGLDHLAPAINVWRCTLHLVRRAGHHRAGGRGAAAAGRRRHAAVQGRDARPDEGRQDHARASPAPPKSLWLVYCAITAVGIIALRLAGMSWLDAVCHCFSAVGLGAFSTHDANVAYFNSPAIELTLCALIIVASLSFSRHFLALRQLSLAPYTRDPEARAVLLVLTVSVLAIAMVLEFHHTYATFGTGLRHALFNVVSVATTSGLVSQDYSKLAGVRTVLDAVPVLHRLQHRLGRRRHQDVPHPAAGPPGGTGVEAAGASQRRGAGAHRWPAGTGPGLQLRACVHFSVFHDRHGADLRPAAVGSGLSNGDGCHTGLS